MAKRRPNVSIVHSEDSKFDADSCSSTENEYGSDFDYEPLNKRKRNFRRNSKLRGETMLKHIPTDDLPVENKEHTYSCVPLFTNSSNNNEADDRNCSDYSFESDDPMRKCKTRRISYGSTSPNSVENSGCVSSTQNFKSKRKPKCDSKNAVMARMNRERKKKYVESLEGNVESLKESNSKLLAQVNEQKEEISSLKNEIKYLKSVLSNSKEIGVLLRRISGVNKELKITSSLLNVPTPQNEEVVSGDEICKGMNERFSDYFSNSLGFSPHTISHNNFILDDNLSIGDCNDFSFFTPPDDLSWQLSSEFDTSEIDKILLSDTAPADVYNLTDFDSANPYGVCLHVANKQVSLEFCASCNRSAMGTSDSDFFTSIK